MPFPILSDRSGRGRSLIVEPQREERGDLATELARFSVSTLQAADTFGHVYAAGSVIEMLTDEVGRPIARGADSIPIIRYALNGSRVDTIAIMPTGYAFPSSVHNADGSISAPMSLGSYAPVNDWLVSPDGRLLLIDAATYGVRVLGPEGNVVVAWQQRDRKIATSDSGWAAHVQREGGVQREMLDRASRSFPGLQLPERLPPRIVPDKPTFLPPVAFHGPMVRTTHLLGDRVFIPVNAADPPTGEFWDVLDLATGRLIITLSLPERHRLLHVGTMGAYVVAVDDDDLERVLRLAMPSLQ